MGRGSRLAQRRKQKAAAKPKSVYKILEQAPGLEAESQVVAWKFHEKSMKRRNPNYEIRPVPEELKEEVRIGKMVKKAAAGRSCWLEEIRKQNRNPNEEPISAFEVARRRRQRMKQAAAANASSETADTKINNQVIDFEGNRMLHSSPIPLGLQAEDQSQYHDMLLQKNNWQLQRGSNQNICQNQEPAPKILNQNHPNSHCSSKKNSSDGGNRYEESDNEQFSRGVNDMDRQNYNHDLDQDREEFPEIRIDNFRGNDRNFDQNFARGNSYQTDWSYNQQNRVSRTSADQDCDLNAGLSNRDYLNDNRGSSHKHEESFGQYSNARPQQNNYRDNCAGMEYFGRQLAQNHPNEKTTRTNDRTYFRDDRRNFSQNYEEQFRDFSSRRNFDERPQRNNYRNEVSEISYTSRNSDGNTRAVWNHNNGMRYQGEPQSLANSSRCENKSSTYQDQSNSNRGYGSRWNH